MTRRAKRWAAAALLLTMVGAGCSEAEPTEDATEPEGTVPQTICEPGALIECARMSTIADLVPDGAPVAADGEPITLGMVNQENTPAASFPELSQAAQSAIDFVNEQMGGVDGRPIELTVCNTEFSTEGSTACGQQFVDAEVSAVLGGIDVFGNANDVLEANGVPFIGGIPVSDQSMQSPLSFQWSGGTWGSTVAMADVALRELDAQSVAIVYGDFGSVTQGAEYAQTVLERNGAEVQMVPFPITATDVSSPLQAAAAGDPDAIFVLAADTSCKPSLEGVGALGYAGAVFMTGACATPTIIDEVDLEASEDVYFTVENSLEGGDPDTDLYTLVVEEYSDGLDPIGAGTVSFRSFINLYSVLRELGAEGITSDAIVEAIEGKVDAPSFMGHDYTCDHEQFEGLPAACSPQQVMGQMHDRNLDPVGGWIDVGAVYAG